MIIQLLEVVGSKVEVVPLETKPLYVFHDRIDVFSIFFGGIRVVESEITLTVVLLCDSKIKADAFGVTDV